MNAETKMSKKPWSADSTAKLKDWIGNQLLQADKRREGICE